MTSRRGRRAPSADELRGCCAPLRVAVTPPGGSEHALVLFGVVADQQLLLKSVWAAGLGMDERLFTHAPWEEGSALLVAVESSLETFQRLAGKPISFEKAAHGPVEQIIECQTLAEAQHVGEALAAITGVRSHVIQGRQVRTQAALEICATAAAYAKFAGLEQVPTFSKHVTRSVNRFLRLWFDLSMPGPSVGNFFARLGIGVAVLIVGVAGFIAIENPLRWLFGAVAILGLVIAGRVIFDKATKLALYHKNMGAGLRRLYTQPSHHLRADFPADWLVADPMPRKLSQDLADAGGRHCYDIFADAVPKAHGRLFFFPQRHAYFYLNFLRGTDQLQMFPGQPTFLIETYFTDGWRLVSVNTGAGFRKGIPELKTIGRIFRDVKHPLDLLERHMQVVQRLTREGKSPVNHDPDTMLARINEHFEKARALLQNRTIYTWGDALHEVFGVVRKEYLEPAEQRTLA